MTVEANRRASRRDPEGLERQIKSLTSLTISSRSDRLHHSSAKALRPAFRSLDQQVTAHRSHTLAGFRGQCTVEGRWAGVGGWEGVGGGWRGEERGDV